ncbi:hypothetical protein GUJ93_ZPchr0008g12420 [Zizania palustris]|uniref:Uncharacterized protein n=1 Tax=Zizania palustris TaxID=103762 RepID=A0A8J5UX48_ZIZPA|nr:hypothetical protein GUJ93_ZPchr0008g12420 [Zizania palustris]
MESSHITGDDGEGCNSSESGWTMYLVSPMHGDDDGGGKGSGSEGSNVDDGYGYISVRGSGDKKYQDDGDGDDDDSLASDASTGPAKVKVSTPEGDEDGGGHRKHDDDENNGRKEEEEDHGMHAKLSMSSRKKASKTEKGGEGKTSRKGHNKRGSSSRTSFFW